MIQIANVSHTYTDSHALCALEGISLSAARGEIVALVGRSGCGKTTLLKIVGGLLTPSKGHVTVDGVSAEQARAARRFGMVFQNPVLFPWRTVRQNILLPFELRSSRNESKQDREEAGRTAADLVGLSAFWDAYPSQLSGGMQARVAIARALSYRPEVLLMDEPFGSLDEITRTTLNQELLCLHQQIPVTWLFVTHSLREAAFLANRVVVLTARPGRVQAVLNVPKVDDRIAWRESGDFSKFCKELRTALGD